MPHCIYFHFLQFINLKFYARSLVIKVRHFSYTMLRGLANSLIEVTVGFLTKQLTLWISFSISVARMTRGPLTAYSMLLIHGFKLSMVTVCCQAADDMFLDDFQLLQWMGVGELQTADDKVDAAVPDAAEGLLELPRPRTECRRRPTACLAPREAMTSTAISWTTWLKLH